MRISVVIPAYNAARFLPRCLKSVFSQTLQPKEVIVVDDGSTDNTAIVAAELGARVISRPNGGISAARNTGIRSASCEWIALLDADDLWRADKLERQAEAIRENPAADFVYTGYCVFSGSQFEKATPVPPASRIREKLMNGVPFAVSSVAIRLSKVIEVGGFDPTMTFCEDWDMWHRLCKAGAEFAAVNEPLTFYRKNPSGLYHSQIARSLEYQEIVVRRHIACDAPAIVRWWRQTRLISRLEGEAAIVRRETGAADYFKYMQKSLLRFPFPLSLADKRYKVGLHMLLTRLGLLRRPAGDHL